MFFFLYKIYLEKLNLFYSILFYFILFYFILPYVFKNDYIYKRDIKEIFALKFEIFDENKMT